jgi:anti-sigma regulatory factor (Ser/Thr protein kinase)
MARENFKRPVKNMLASRAGNRCPYPGCTNPTTGPSGDDAIATAGMACHIYPASGKGPRASLPLPPGVSRTGLKNGVWMCWTHGRIIDQDDGRFSPSTLVAYRLRAEEVAAEEFYGIAVSPSPRLLVCHTATIPVNIGGADWEQRLNTTWRDDLHNALSDGGVSAAWGADAQHAVWMVFAEMIRNTIEHGSGSDILVETDRNTAEIFIRDEQFGIEQLLSQSQPGGGAESLVPFRQDLGERLEISAESTDDGTYIRVNARVSASPLDPCSVQLERSELTTPQLLDLQGCSIVHIYAPERLMLSDRWIVPTAVTAALKIGARVAVHHRREQTFLVQNSVKQKFQNELNQIEFREIE